MWSMSIGFHRLLDHRYWSPTHYLSKDKSSPQLHSKPHRRRSKNTCSAGWPPRSGWRVRRRTTCNPPQPRKDMLNVMVGGHWFKTPTWHRSWQSSGVALSLSYGLQYEQSFSNSSSPSINSPISGSGHVSLKKQGQAWVLHSPCFTTSIMSQSLPPLMASTSGNLTAALVPPWQLLEQGSHGIHSDHMQSSERSRSEYILLLHCFTSTIHFINHVGSTGWQHLLSKTSCWLGSHSSGIWWAATVAFYCPGWRNIPNPSQQEVFTYYMCHPVH